MYFYPLANPRLIYPLYKYVTLKSVNEVSLSYSCSGCRNVYAHDQ